jgi:hypothetical protein
LNALEPKEGSSQAVNCSDVAAAVYAFANLLGCNLTIVALRMDRTLNNDVCFNLRPVRPLGHSAVAEGIALASHQVAWSGTLDRNGLVYDACLAFPEGDHPEPVCGLRFGDVREKGGYIAQLTPNAAAILLRKIDQRSIAPLRADTSGEFPQRHD